MNTRMAVMKLAVPDLARTFGVRIQATIVTGPTWLVGALAHVPPESIRSLSRP
jgi:hypothetical protein